MLITCTSLLIQTLEILGFQEIRRGRHSSGGRVNFASFPEHEWVDSRFVSAGTTLQLRRLVCVDILWLLFLPTSDLVCGSRPVDLLNPLVSHVRQKSNQGSYYQSHNNFRVCHHPEVQPIEGILEDISKCICTS